MGCVSSKDGTTPAPGVARASSAAPTTIAGATGEARTATVARVGGFAEVPLRPGHERKRGSGRERETRASERGTPSASDAAVIRDMTDAVSSVGKGGATKADGRANGKTIPKPRPVGRRHEESEKSKSQRKNERKRERAKQKRAEERAMTEHVAPPAVERVKSSKSADKDLY